MFVEYALRRSASTISSVAATSALRITSNVIGSIRSRSAPGIALLPVRSSSTSPASATTTP